MLHRHASCAAVVQLTSFKQAIVPPPMCQFTLTVASSTPVLECCFSPRTADAAFDGDGMVALLLADGSVAVTPCSRGVSAAVPALRCGELLDGCECCVLPCWRWCIPLPFVHRLAGVVLC